MAVKVVMKNVVKHLVNGSLGDNLCLLCLTPLEECCFENIFTFICKEESKYCIADALEAVCQVKLNHTENYNVCFNCLESATAAFKFHLKAKQSLEIISFYTQQLLDSINHVEITEKDLETLFCIPLPLYQPKTKVFKSRLDTKPEEKPQDSSKSSKVKEEISKIGDYQSDDLILVVEKENTSELDKLLKQKTKGYSSISDDDDDDDDDDDEMLMIVNEKKERKKRDPMAYMSCSQCPVKYRFVSKLRKHMKNAHNVDVYYCKICKITSENKQEYEAHLKSHAGHQCTICNVVYKKSDTLLAHMKMHDEDKDLQPSENSNICEVCGAILPDEMSLHTHMADKHIKKFACYYCGRMYKGEGSFEAHVRKHEHHMAKITGTLDNKPDKKEVQSEKRDKTKRSVCQTCGKDFVDERSLLWHQRLHNDDRPFTCDVCGRSFVSASRRNQHSTCAHTPPTRRCPLCPALFHLRSMVNTHLKKVHLKAHKRRSRTSVKHNVYWKTEPVPLQELSVAVQARLLDYTAHQSGSSTMCEFMDESQTL